MSMIAADKSSPLPTISRRFGDSAPTGNKVDAGAATGVLHRVAEPATGVWEDSAKDTATAVLGDSDAEGIVVDKLLADVEVVVLKVVEVSAPAVVGGNETRESFETSLNRGTKGLA